MTSFMSHPGVNIINVLITDFIRTDPERVRTQSNCQSHFMLLGVECWWDDGIIIGNAMIPFLSFIDSRSTYRPNEWHQFVWVKDSFDSL